LARALSKLGYCSRSQAAALIRAGRVTLNGAARQDPETPVQIERDRIAVEGHVIKAAENVYLMMNKPRGLVTTASDEKGRDTVYTLFSDQEKSLPWVAPVGRLDKASEGLLLLTNNSEWGARITAEFCSANLTRQQLSTNNSLRACCHPAYLPGRTTRPASD